jgi:hypothetical protein
MGIKRWLGLKQPRYTYNQDGLATTHSSDFMHEPQFAAAYAAGEATGSWRKSRVHWRAHVLLWAAQIADRLDGDFVECGTYKGGLAMTLATFFDFAKQKRRMFLFDTFTGIDPELASESENTRRGFRNKYPGDVYEEVRERFAPFPNIHVIRGRVPETLPQAQTDKVAFLHIDMNNAAPEIAAAEYFWPKLIPGAPVVLDDYGWKDCGEQKAAFDRFAKRKGIPLLSLPTGQGMLIKR